MTAIRKKIKTGINTMWALGIKKILLERFEGRYALTWYEVNEIWNDVA